VTNPGRSRCSALDSGPITHPGSTRYGTVMSSLALSLQKPAEFRLTVAAGEIDVERQLCPDQARFALQQPGDQSSTTVAQAKIERHEPTDVRFAAVNPSQQQASPAKRAIATSQQALLERASSTVLR
jgi:hypothetical protein